MQSHHIMANRWGNNGNSGRFYILGEPCLFLLPSGPRGSRCRRMEPGTGAFSVEEFWEACAELQRPALSGATWELLEETQGISVYRLLDQVAVRPQRTAGRQSSDIHFRQRTGIGSSKLTKRQYSQ